MLHRCLWTLGLTLALVPACRETAGPDAPATSSAPSASAPTFEREGPAPVASTPAPVPQPAVSASASAVASADPPEEEPKPEEEPEAPLPDIEVKNVGMHIGGEENTSAQKRPIRAEVAKQYDAMKRCWAMATEPPDKATFGVDMRIDGKGGPAKITNPRSGLKGDGVKDCMVQAFEAVVFPRQPGGVDRMVSFSVEFRKK